MPPPQASTTSLTHQPLTIDPSSAPELSNPQPNSNSHSDIQPCPPNTATLNSARPQNQISHLRPEARDEQSTHLDINPTWSIYNSTLFFAPPPTTPTHYPSPAVLACVRDPERFSRRAYVSQETGYRFPTTDSLKHQEIKCSSEPCSAPNSLYEGPEASASAGAPTVSPLLRSKRSFRNLRRGVWRKKEGREQKGDDECLDTSPNDVDGEEQIHNYSGSSKPSIDKAQVSPAEPDTQHTSDQHNTR